MKREFSAGGAVFKAQNGQVFWLIIKPRPSQDFPSDRFQLPKGHIENGEKPEATALREVEEETGIMGKILQKISDQKYMFPFRGEKIFKVVSFFLMEYVSGEPKVNDEVEKIDWLPFEEAYKTLSFSHDKSVLKNAQALLSKSVNR